MHTVWLYGSILLLPLTFIDVNVLNLHGPLNYPATWGRHIAIEASQLGEPD